jgi:probable rRNA maturation factor
LILWKLADKKMIEINNRSGRKIKVGEIKKIAEFFLDHYNIINKDVSIAIVKDEEMKDLNKKYRGQDKPTDVLSFAEIDSSDPDDDDYLGEIVLDHEQIKRQAREIGKSTEDELVFILVHGLLHLLGMTDDTEGDRKKMIKEGEDFMELMNKKNVQPKKTA